MRYFDNGNRVNQDECAQQARDRENQSVTDYRTFNFYELGNCTERTQNVRDFSAQNPNLVFRMGYGVTSACAVDSDNKLRYGADVTHGPERQTLCPRSFVASPNLSRGTFIPNLESQLLNGVDTLETRDCHKLAESQFDVFMPLSSCVEKFVHGAAAVLDDDIRIGRPSKDIFLENRKAAACAGKK